MVRRELSMVDGGMFNLLMLSNGRANSFLNLWHNQPWNVLSPVQCLTIRVQAGQIVSAGKANSLIRTRPHMLVIVKHHISIHQSMLAGMAI
jgi:hypothetical protein